LARTLAHKYRLKSRAKVYSKFGKDLTIFDLKNRDKNNKPKVTSLVKPNYKQNVWDFQITEPKTLVSSLYAESKSMANLDNLACTVCGSTYKVEMHHIRMMKDLKPKANRVD
jgi:hypothetical protein